jgi:hypothetical protein
MFVEPYRNRGVLACLRAAFCFLDVARRTQGLNVRPIVEPLGIFAMFDDVIDLELACDLATLGALVGGLDQHPCPEMAPLGPAVPALDVVLGTASPADQNAAARLTAVLHD